MLYGVPPFAGRTDEETTANILNSRFQAGIARQKLSSGARCVLSSLLHADQELRGTPEEILEFNWLAQEAGGRRGSALGELNSLQNLRAFREKLG